MRDRSDIAAPLARFAMRRPVTIYMLFLSFLMLGLISSRLLPLEKFPGIDIPQIAVVVPYPGASPGEVERLITRPIEEALATISGVVEMVSDSRDDSSQVVLDFNWNDSISSRGIEVREAIDSVRHTLPADVERIFVYQFNTDDMAVMQLRISSERDLSMAYDLINRNLKQPLERLDGVSRVDLFGVDRAEIIIRLRPDAVTAAGLSALEITQVLHQANFTLNAGAIETHRERIQVTPIGDFRNLDDIRRLPITEHLTLSDIADIGFELPRPRAGRSFNRTYAIGIDIYKESNANLIDVARAASQVIEAADGHPEFAGIFLMTMDNSAESVTTSLRDLLLAGLLGACLSIIVLYLFLRDLRVTAVIVLSVPIAIFLTLGSMYLLGYSLNILSMMGLMLAVGMLIDNAVVVSESIKQEQQDALERGEIPNKTTVEMGAGRVSLAIIAGTLTTAIVFLPNIFGEKQSITIFLEHVAVTICISLLASLFIAQTLIPLLLSKLMTRKQKKVANNGRIKRFYLHSLRWSHRHPRWTSFIMLILLLSTAIPFNQVTGNQTEMAFNDSLFLNYHVTGQYKLEQVERDVHRLEAYLYEHSDRFEIDHVYSYYTPGYAMSIIRLKPNRTLSITEIQRRIRADMPPLARSRPAFGFQGGNTNGVQITLQGRSTVELAQVAEQLIPQVKKIQGLTDVQTASRNALAEIQIHLDRAQLERFGLSTRHVADQIDVALRGRNMRSFRHHPEGDMRIQVIFPESIQRNLSELEGLVVGQTFGQIITLNQVAQFKQKEQLGAIRRFDRKTAIRITANLDEISLSQARSELENFFASIDLPSGISWSLDGGFRTQQQENQIMLVNMLLAFALVYMVMAALFESFLLPSAVIGSLLMAICGAFWGLMFTSTPLDVMALIGLLILMGIVVNNGIVLVDAINQERMTGASLEAALMSAASRRVRPILMTVVTTVLGMLPLAMGNTQIGGDGPPYAPMALTIISGLIFSTITSLYFVPHAYSRLLFWRSYWVGLWHHAGGPLRTPTKST